ncbi:MAG: hypothetical protein ACPL3Q_06750 [Candidatus Ratteibacteria bacterium]
MKRNLKCSICGKKVSVDEVFGFYPEDDSLICKKCFSNFFVNPGKKSCLKKTHNDNE